MPRFTLTYLFVGTVFDISAGMCNRSYEDRLDTISNVREAGISVCCGGILGLGEVSLDAFTAGHPFSASH